MDPDGDQLTYKWSCPAGTVAQPSNRETLWTAPMQEGPVPCTVTVTDGKGGTVSDTVTIQVVKPAIKDYTFEDVHFDFDRYTLRPEATRILDEAIKALQDNTRAEARGRRPHLQHRYGRIQPRPRRASCLLGARLPGLARHRCRPHPHRELR